MRKSDSDSNWLQRGIGLVIRVYQIALAPALGPACRFEPSCSRYAAEAVERHGAARGSWLALRRVLRCHPLGGSGFDPVPGGE
ncbi:MAG TPA: membrane protein insertion efficiency factor YidD [Myxococcota bacterium]|nr:membrane protein insertion efficiency factor YidD [Myxococcota bacterium]